MESVVHVAVTAATGEIAYSLLPMIANGDALGELQPVILQILDYADYESELEGLTMELEDSVFPLLQDIIVTNDPAVAFKNAKCAFIMDGGPINPNVEHRNAWNPSLPYFKEMGEALEQHAPKDIKVLVLGIRPNSCALVCSRFAPSIPQQNFSALTRLEQNRAMTILANKLEIPANYIENVVVWGNCTHTIYPDVYEAVIRMKKKEIQVSEAIGDYSYLKNTFVNMVQKRGTALQAKRERATAISISKAACEHMRDWWLGTPAGRLVSMAVMSDGSYGVPHNIICSFPVRVDKKKRWTIVPGLKLDFFSQATIGQLNSGTIAGENGSVRILQYQGR